MHGTSTENASQLPRGCFLSQFLLCAPKAKTGGLEAGAGYEQNFPQRPKSPSCVPGLDQNRTIGACEDRRLASNPKAGTSSSDASSGIPGKPPDLMMIF